MVRRRRDFAPWVLVLGLSTVTGCDHPAAAVETDGGTEAAPADSDAGSEGDPGGGTTTSTTDGGDCAPGLVACGSDCVDTATDPGHCGGCSDACGADQLCATGECVDAPADCSVAGAMCPAGHFCDVATRACLVGCAFDDDCPQPGTCDLSTHTCSCDPGTNFCGMGCVAEGPSACGSSCETCSAAPANAAPACVSSQCDFDCVAGFHRCGDACVASDSVDHCASSCAPCPTDPNGTAACTTGGCALNCDAGFHLGGGGCEADCSAGSCNAGLYCDGVVCQTCPQSADESEPNDTLAQATPMQGMGIGGGAISDATGLTCGAADVDVWSAPELDQYPNREWIFQAMGTGVWEITVRRGDTLLASRTCSVDDNCNSTGVNILPVFGSGTLTITVELVEGPAPQPYYVAVVQTA